MTGKDKQGLRLLLSIMFRAFGILGILFSILLLIVGKENVAAFVYFGISAVFAIVGIILKNSNRKICQNEEFHEQKKAMEISAESENFLKKKWKYVR